MRYLIFDTETTGFTNRKAPPQHESQPYLLEFGCRLVSGPGLENIDEEWRVLINWADLEEIPKAASDVHKITMKRLRKEGELPLTVMKKFNELVLAAESVCAFNLNFDEVVAHAAYWRVGGTGKALSAAGKVCIMQSARPVCKLPRIKSTAGGYKPPSLKEAYELLVDKKGFEDAHTALADCAAAHEVLKKLVAGGHGLVYVREEPRRPSTTSSASTGATGEQRLAGSPKEALDFKWLDKLLATAVEDAEGVLSDWESSFVQDFADRREKYGDRTNISSKQHEILKRIEETLRSGKRSAKR